MEYQLELRRKKLLELCVIWKQCVENIPSSNGSTSWGPSILEIAAIQAKSGGHEEEEDCSSVGSESDGEDAEIIDLIEDFGMLHGEEDDHTDTVLEGTAEVEVYIAKKRHRVA